MAWQKSPETLIETFYQVLPDDPRVERRKMFGYPCAFAGGYMFAGLHEANLIVRLPEDERAAMLTIEGARIFEPMAGRPMREYVAVPPALLAEPEALRAWLEKALDYALTLPPRAEGKRPGAKKRGGAGGRPNP